MKLRLLNYWIALGLTLATQGCNGTALDVGSPGDGGRDACVQTACGSGEVWDSVTCACVASHPHCTPPSSCPGGQIFDAFQCACIQNPSAPDAGAHDASPAEFDAVVNPCGDISPTCCVVSASGCTTSSAPASGDPCSGWRCPNGGMQIQGSCPVLCNPADDGGAGCLTAADCAAGEVCWNDSPLQTTDGVCVANPCGTAALTCGCAASLCNGITTGIGACAVADGGLVSCLSGG
jgi:hypothetical protein